MTVDSCKVFVTCWTYNQSKYIKDTLDGFCMQLTDFPFVCGIVDDASTDGEPAYIQGYLERNFETIGDEYYSYDETDDYRRVFAQHKSNKNCFFLVVYLKYNHYQLKKAKMPYISEWRQKAQYLAICEGDDYWIDVQKLKKQVVFMDTHPNHSLCFCAHKDLYPSGELKDVYRYVDDKEVCPLDDIIQGGGAFMATNSMLYRNSMYVHYSVWVQNCPVGDLPLMLTMAHRGLVGYIAKVMCVYRRSLAGSWTNSLNSSYKNRRRHYKAIQKMWTRFDEYSNKQNHYSVMKKIKTNRKQFYRYEVITFLLKIRNAIRRINK